MTYLSVTRKIIASKTITTSTILLPECHEPRTRKRHSFMANPLETLKSKVSSLGKKSEEQARKEDAEEQEQEEEKEPSRESFEVALPQRRPQSPETTARRFPEDWQTSLYPQGSTLRPQTQASRRHTFDGLLSPARQIWPSLGARCKFFRLVVVASPSLQRLASQDL
ncbi:hypothetical protein PTTG_12536 [Puccinia triticina 1-1 BBBD Race 1]|uniref:Uncharacterized protein n=1 Tax=Puccinia triticina (isolate 1-1 / race 1 (BBBD)) TaxID=630390 RepID=A0A180H564_PUCT1|nr:hypothetical protein PTTG_12536 [Puccinia triticina 1-1 BBBD Race 1]